MKRLLALAVSTLLTGCIATKQPGYLGQLDDYSDTAGVMGQYTGKASPTTSDKVDITDVAASNATKTTTLGALPVSTAMQTALDGKQSTLTNASTLAKITESAGSPLWDGSAWPGGAGATINDSAGDGDTGVVWSADKSFDSLALKLDKSGGAMTGTLSMGIASTTSGLINFYNSSKAYPTGVYSIGADVPSVGIRLPGTMPTESSILAIDTNGYLSFTAWSLLSLNASGFDGNLATTDDTLQEVAQKFDDFVSGASTQLDALTDVTGNGTTDYILYDDGDGTYSFRAAPSGSFPGFTSLAVDYSFGSTAAEITIADAGDYFTGGNVEAALQELGATDIITFDLPLYFNTGSSTLTIQGVTFTTTGLTAGKPYYMASEGSWTEADANGTGTYPARCIAISTTQCVSQGQLTSTSHGFTVGATLWLSTSVGTISTTQPSTSGDAVQSVGWVYDANTLIINVSPDYATVQ